MWFALGTFFIVVGIGLAIRTICHSIEMVVREVRHFRIEIRKEFLEQEKIIVDEFQKTRDTLICLYKKERG